MNVNKLYEQLEKRYELLSKGMAIIEKRMNQYPEGSLNFKICNNSPQYYAYLGNKESEAGKRKVNMEYLSKKERKLAQVLAQKDYERGLINIIKREQLMIARLIREVEKGTPESFYDNLPDARQKLVNPIFKSKKWLEEEWLNEEYSPLMMDVPPTDLYSDKGEMVKSKSELLIANKLFSKGILYKYERPFNLKNRKTVYPDFTCMNRQTGDIIYWEHLGMMDKLGYCERNISKLNDLIDSGLVMGKDLIITLETSGMMIKPRVVDKIISTFLE